MYPITAIIVVKGNPPHITESMESIKGFVKEIIVADIGIDTETKEKLTPYKITYVQIKEPVAYVELIREKLKKNVTQPYVLFLDPDEIIPAPLQKKWGELYDKYDFLETSRKNIIMGKWIQHSRWWPDYQIRLFKKESVTWPTVIHKQPTSSGNGYKLMASENLAILHFNYESMDEFFSKMTRYAKAEAFNLVTTKTHLSFEKTVKDSVSEFISRYFAGEGYKDGMHGFILAFFQMMYPFLVYSYYQEATQFQSAPSEKELMQSGTSFFGRLFKESLFWKAKKNNSTLKEKVVEKLIG